MPSANRTQILQETQFQGKNQAKLSQIPSYKNNLKSSNLTGWRLMEDNSVGNEV